MFKQQANVRMHTGICQYHIVSYAIIVIALMAFPGRIAAQAYPTKPIRFIVPFAAGGGNDIVGRLIGGKLSEAWGQQVVIDNRTGAGGNIGAEIVARSAPDGYTIFLFNSATAIAPSLYKSVQFDPVKDYEPVILISTAPFALVVQPSLPAQSVKELIALAKAKPKQYAYASGGNGTSTHLTAEQFKHMAGIDVVHVPYRGGGPALVELIMGHVTLYFASIPPVVPHVKAGRLRALAISSDKRSPLWPELPTIAEAALPGFESGASYGLVTPAHTPAAIVRKLNTEVSRILSDGDIRSRLAGLGMEIASGTPQDFARYMKAEMAKWAQVIKTSGARVD